MNDLARKYIFNGGFQISLRILPEDLERYKKIKKNNLITINLFDYKDNNIGRVMTNIKDIEWQ